MKSGDLRRCNKKKRNGARFYTDNRMAEPMEERLPQKP